MKNKIKEYLLSRQEEVTSMLDVIFDDTIHRRKQQEEAFAAGEARGKKAREQRAFFLQQDSEWEY